MTKDKVVHSKDGTRTWVICPKYKGGKKLPNCEGYKAHSTMYKFII